jgi:exopolysaccharide production protein ExoZ
MRIVPIMAERRSLTKVSEVVSIQYLRAFAALLVVFHHARQFPGFKDVIGTGIGVSGVDIFFVISGFVMALTAGRAGYPALTFLKRRGTRIVPLYWVVTLLVAILPFAAPGVFTENAFTWKHLVLSLLFIPHVAPIAPFNYSPLITVGWTLNFEVFFYLVFAALMMFRLSTRIVSMVILFSALIVIDALWHPDFTPLRFWADGQLFEFVMGCAIGWLYVNGHLAKLSVPVAWLGIVGACVAFAIFGANSPDAPRVILFGIPSAALVAGAVCLDQHGRIEYSAIWKFLGDASYSIYLIHLSAILVVRKLWIMADLPTDGLVNALIFMFISMAIGTLSGIASYLYLERPMLNFFRRRRGSSRGSSPLVTEFQDVA